MSDINPDTPDKPIEVSKSATGDQVATAGRDIALVVAALPAFVALFGKHNMKDAVDFIASSGFAPVVALAVPVLVGARQWLARRRHAREVTMAKAAPNDVAVVKS